MFHLSILNSQSVKVQFEQLVVFGKTHEEYFSVYEASPVVDALEFEACLNGIDLQAIQIVFKLGTVLRQTFQEEISRVES